MKQLPANFHEDTYEGNVVCAHRDLSCCPICADAHEEIIEVYGLHFWVINKAERQTLTKTGA